MVKLTEQIRRRVEGKKFKIAQKMKARLAAKMNDPNFRKKLLQHAVATDNVQQ